MKKLLRIAAVSVLGVTLTTGLASAHSVIDTTGQNSSNTIEHNEDYDWTVDSTNTVVGSVSNSQGATSGDATVDGNTNGEDASTGNAKNWSSQTVEVSQHN